MGVVGGGVVYSVQGVGYGLGGPGFESRRSRWPRRLRLSSVAARFLGLGFRIPLGSWICVFCVLYSTDKRQKPGQLDQRTNKVQRQNKNPSRKKYFSLLKNIRIWVPPSLLLNGYRGSLLGIKCSGRKVKHSRLSSAEVNNEQNYTSASPVCLQEVHRKNFLLYFQMGLIIFFNSEVKIIFYFIREVVKTLVKWAFFTSLKNL